MNRRGLIPWTLCTKAVEYSAAPRGSSAGIGRVLTPSRPIRVASALRFFRDSRMFTPYKRRQLSYDHRLKGLVPNIWNIWGQSKNDLLSGPVAPYRA